MATIVYTPGYAPPELRAGKPEPRSDLFSLAATLYRLATGRDPRDEETAQDIDALLNDRARPVPAQHRWFFELLKINLSEDVHDRYFSAAEFKADLEKRQVTRETRCRKCGANNEVRKPYCRKCSA